MKIPFLEANASSLSPLLQIVTDQSAKCLAIQACKFTAGTILFVKGCEHIYQTTIPKTNLPAAVEPAHTSRAIIRIPSIEHVQLTVGVLECLAGAAIVYVTSIT